MGSTVSGKRNDLHRIPTKYLHFSGGDLNYWSRFFCGNSAVDGATSHCYTTAFDGADRSRDRELPHTILIRRKLFVEVRRFLFWGYVVRNACRQVGAQHGLVRRCRWRSIPLLTQSNRSKLFDNKRMWGQHFLSAVYCLLAKQKVHRISFPRYPFSGYTGNTRAYRPRRHGNMPRLTILCISPRPGEEWLAS